MLFFEEWHHLRSNVMQIKSIQYVYCYKKSGATLTHHCVTSVQKN